MRRLIKFLKYLLVAILFLVFCFAAESAIDNSNIEAQIAKFKENLLFSFYSERGNINYFNTTYEHDYLGDMGDILVTLDNKMFDEPLNHIISYFIGGHAAITNGKYLVEVVTDLKNGVIVGRNSWLYDHYYADKFIVLSVNTTDEIKKLAYESALEKKGLPYNFTYIFNRKKSYYCTDLITTSYADAGCDLNINQIIILVKDLILSEKTSIKAYKEVNTNPEYPGQYNVYIK